MERRIRLQRALHGAVTGACMAALIAITAVALEKATWIDGSSFSALVALGVALIPLFALVTWWPRPDPIALAQRIDETHGLYDRLSTALSLATRRDEHPDVDDAFILAQLNDALRHIDAVALDRAAPFKRPADLMPLAIFLVAILAVSAVQLPNHIHPLPDPPLIRYTPVLDAATLAIERDRLEEIRREIGDDASPETLELLDELEALLDAAEAGDITEREFLEKLAELQTRFFDESSEKDAIEALTDALKQAAESLKEEAPEALAEQEEFKELIEALEKKDLAAASKAVEKLAERLLEQGLDADQAEQLAELLKNFADKLDKEDQRLQELYEKHQQQLDALADKLDLERSEGGQDQQEGGSDEKSRLDREDQTAPARTEDDPKVYGDVQRELKRLREGAEAMAEGLEKDAEQQRGGEDQQRDPNKPDYQNEVGRGAEQAAQEFEEAAKRQQNAETQEQARRQMEEMRETLKRSQAQQEEQRQAQERRGEQMRDFLDRARGEKESRSDDEIFGQPGERGEDGSERGAQDQQDQLGEQRDDRAQGEMGEDGQGGPPPDSADGDGDGLDGDQPGGQQASATGPEGPTLGDEETSLDSERIRERAEAQQGKGQSRSEIIKGASEEGFATTEYQDVFVDYESVVEEVMERDKVPAGYRYYIKRYFQLIRPQQE